MIHMESKFLVFVDVSDVLEKQTGNKKKTKDFLVKDKTFNGTLGYINWRASWRKYVFTSGPGGCILDASCMSDIIHFINELMDKRKLNTP
jgi:hypothetical protein